MPPKADYFFISDIVTVKFTCARFKFYNLELGDAYEMIRYIPLGFKTL